MRLEEAADPRLEQVRLAADADRMRERMADFFARAGRAERVESLSVVRVYYMPGQDFDAVYEMVLRSGDAVESQTLYGSIRYQGGAEELVAKAARKAAKGKFRTPGLGDPAYHFPDLCMAAWTFPNDPKMKTLGANFESDRVHAALAHLRGPDDGPGWELGAVGEPELVRYIPRKRCVLRYELAWHRQHAADGSPVALPASSLQRVYGKVYDDAAAARQAHAVLEALWRATPPEGRTLRVPRPLLHDAELLTAYQEAVPGTHLARAAEHVTPAQVSTIARGLAHLQQARVRLDPVLRLEDELAKLHEHAACIAMAHPQFAARLGAIETRLADRLPRLPRLPLVPAHGTFKLNHLLADGERTSLVDFDSMTNADPLYDVANFTADLHYLEAQGVLPAGRAERLGRTLHEAWLSVVPWGRRDAVLDWYVSSLLVRKQALKPVKHLHPDAVAKIERVLEAARARLEGS
jgi:aminoglycoside phosphotransferase (APT) family kinase protein